MFLKFRVSSHLSCIEKNSPMVPIGPKCRDFGALRMGIGFHKFYGSCVVLDFAFFEKIRRP